MAQHNEKNQSDLIDRVLNIKRCAAVVKGGRRFSFAALVVVGDGKGRVGFGYGKAKRSPAKRCEGSEASDSRDG